MRGAARLLVPAELLSCVDLAWAAELAPPTLFHAPATRSPDG